MQKLLLVFYNVFIILTVFSCTKKRDKNDELVLVDIEANMKKVEIVSLSQFANAIYYVPLQSKENLTLNYISSFDITENYILVTDNKLCLLFDSLGRNISKIGNIGRGPGEFPYITDLWISKNKNIFLKVLYDLNVYNLNGTFVKKYSKSFYVNDKYYIYSCFPVCDSLFFGHVPNSTGQKEYKALVVNKFGEIKHFYKNYIFFNRLGEVSSGLEGRAFFNEFENQLFYNDSYNDTLFYLNSEFNLIPKYVFNLGKYKEPVYVRARPLSQRAIDNDVINYLYLQDVFQTKKNIFLNCNFNRWFPAKRITPKTYSLNIKLTNWYNHTNVLGIYDKLTGRLIFSKPTNTDNPLFTTGLYNDIDGGPRFFPQKMVNDSTMMMFIDPIEFKAHITSSDFINSNPKYPEKKKEVEKLADKLTEFDNPVLMFVIFKSR